MKKAGGDSPRLFAFGFQVTLVVLSDLTADA